MGTRSRFCPGLRSDRTAGGRLAGVLRGKLSHHDGDRRKLGLHGHERVRRGLAGHFACGGLHRRCGQRLRHLREHVLLHDPAGLLQGPRVLLRGPCARQVLRQCGQQGLGFRQASVLGRLFGSGHGRTSPGGLRAGMVRGGVRRSLTRKGTAAGWVGGLSLPIETVSLCFVNDSVSIGKASFRFDRVSFSLRPGSFSVGRATFSVRRAPFTLGKPSLPIGKVSFLVGRSSRPIAKATFTA